MLLRPLLLLLTLSSLRAQEPSSSAVNAAIDRGVAWLVQSQQLDGTWDYGDGPRTGHTALIAYTLIKSGLSLEHQAVQRAVTHLEGEYPTLTYDTSLLILALAAHDPDAHGEKIQELVDQLVDWQKPEGFGYPTGGDLSNTQYAALGLWAGAKAGARVPQRTWSDLISGTLRYKARGGGFGYKSGGEQATGSMTAAGVAVLAICRDMLVLKRRGKDARRYRLVADEIEVGLGWLSSNWSVSKNPYGGQQWLGYYLYGLERVGALAPTESIGDHDWYAEGASFLVKGQAKQGHWAPGLGGGYPNTCFALLFLRRATRPVTGGLHATGGRRYDTADTDAGVRIAASGDNPIGMWIASFGKKTSADLAWPDGSGVHVSRVIWVVDGIEVARVEGQEERPSGQERFAHQERFEEPGSHRLQAEVHVLRPPLVDSAGRRYPASLKVLESPPLEVFVENACPEWMLDNARDRGRNLLPLGLPTVRASSERSPAARAVDGHQGRSWVAASTDPTPTLEIDLTVPQEANVILIGHARQTPNDPGRWARALEVDVHVNGKRHRMRMHSDERRKGLLVLPRLTTVRSLKLVVPFAVPGRGGEASTGFAEVELQRRGDLRPGRGR